MTNDLVVKNEISIPKDNGKAVAEARFAISAAKEWPRNENQSILAIENACKRRKLAEKAAYAFPKGNQVVTGPSIRLAEVVARAWGNISFGIIEISRGHNETLYEAFCHDLESNIKSTRTFSQKHVRHTRQGLKQLTTERDIYEIVASQASRRLRACILQVIPSDVIEDALEACNKTLSNCNSISLKDRVKKMVVAFDALGVIESMLVKRVGHKLDAINEIEMVSLQSIYTSLKDNMAKITDFFDYDEIKKEKLNKDYSDKVEKKQETQKKETKMSFPVAITELVNCKSVKDLKKAYDNITAQEWNEKQVEDLERTYIKKEEYLKNGN